MRQRELDYEDILRRALRTAADGIEPAGDGLERIRARLTTPRPLAAAWLMAGYTDAAVPALARLWAVLGSLRIWLSPDAGRAGPPAAAHRRWPPNPVLARLARSNLLRRHRWLRPAAVAAAVIVAVAGGYALAQMPGAKTTTATQNLPLTNSGPRSSGGSVNSRGVGQWPGTTKTSNAGPGLPHSTPSASPSCLPAAPQRGAHPTPTPTATPSSTPTATPTVTPSPTSTPSSTPTPTGSPTSTPTSTNTPATATSPAMSPAGILPPGGSAAPAATPRSTKKSPPMSLSRCGRAAGRQSARHKG